MSSKTSSVALTEFRSNPLSIIGLVLVALCVGLAVFADLVAPYPAHVGPIGDFMAINQAPSAAHWFGTDTIGRDVLTRILYGFRLSLVMAAMVLAISMPIGVALGLMAGYLGGWVEFAIMRLTDVFLAIPPLVLAMAIMGFLPATLTNAMLAVTAMWWPWYTRLVYNVVRSEAREGYVLAAEVIGASPLHVMTREILPNCAPAILTKLTLDVGFVVLMVSSLSFLGLGVQPPTPDLGSMVADGAKYMPDAWWLSIFPALAIMVLVLGFNLLGDGLREAFDAEV
ncbi:ABC transporter permease [Pseudoroseicyclus aestuarii]|uniref:Peptide/nickel transport system permease protein n=1 Tax=Pseudoroseicyclus aestuarii TaxID=1795041 RepID=A0A318SQ05_9RHOB|nr:ABC transporter permease [Pseudoroseicyclus aestuarii]PYE82428.1 peptide/nickel transport system permease protein [Pseudoroseicyclus aestuarii]